MNLFFVPLYFSAAGAAQLPVPHSLHLFGALTHFLVVQLHFTNVQFITAGCRMRKLLVRFSIYSFRLTLEQLVNNIVLLDAKRENKMTFRVSK